MKKSVKRVISCAVVAALTVIIFTTTVSAGNASSKIDKVIAGMSLDEKISQMI